MEELQGKITELAQLMDEFGLEQARVTVDDVLIEFSRHAPVAAGTPVLVGAPAAASTTEPAAKPKTTPKSSAKAGPTGTPISSPMMGIFYSCPSPGQPSFVKEGDTVSAGQVIGLIEAMKVFNEITATTAGRVTKCVAENGQLVQPGDPLIYIG